jgi:hypothetical protein
MSRVWLGEQRNAGPFLTTQEVYVMKVTTNKVPRPIVLGCELSDKEKTEFDYIKRDDLCGTSFVRYKGYVYDLDNFMIYNQEHNGIVWHGAAGDSYFSGTLLHICEDSDFVIMGYYIE